MSNVIRLDGRKHQIPRGLSNFFSDLEARADVEAVETGKYIPSSVKEFNASVQSYNETNRTFRVRVEVRERNTGFVAYLGVRVKHGAARDVWDYIRHYGNGKNGNGD